MLYPKNLKKGDTVALINLSSTVPQERVAPAVKAVEEMGFSVKVYPSCTAKHACFAGTDRQRAADFTEAFCDDTVDGIFCIRGGYGAARALMLVDWEQVEKSVLANPKYFSGYSDVTAAHIALQERFGLVTYHTPMPSTEYYKPLDDFTMSYLNRNIFGQKIAELKNPAGEELITLVPGKAEGRLTGGNLSLLTSAVGTPFDMDTKGKILFMEDIGESSYRVDRMLTQLAQSGKLKDAAGFILGAWTDCEAQGEDAIPLQMVFDEIIKPLGKPTLMNLRCGHCLPTISMPLGVIAQLDADEKTIRLRYE